MSQYATKGDLMIFGAPEDWLAVVEDAVIDGHLGAASSVVDDRLGKQFKLPLVSWPLSVTQAACKIARYTLLVRKGFNPADPADKNVKDEHDKTMAWLDKVEQGFAVPEGVVDSSPSEDDGGPLVFTHCPRGFTSVRTA